MLHEAIFIIVVVFFILRQIFRGIAWLVRALKGTPATPTRIQPQMGTLPTPPTQPRPMNLPQAQIPRPVVPAPPTQPTRPAAVRQEAIPQPVAVPNPYAITESRSNPNQAPSDVQTAAETRQSSKNSQANFSDFLKDRNSLIRSLVLHEILAPPISRRNSHSRPAPPAIDPEL